MFQIDEDMTIYITRGDVAFFSVSAESNGELHKFSKGDVVRIKVFEKKNCSNVAFQKDFPVLEDCDSVNIFLTEEETKIGDVISKPKDYWYEIELNPYTNPQTIIGYDDDGAKIFRLFPEGRDLGNETQAEDVPVVDSELSMTSTRPVENQAVTRGLLEIEKKIEKSNNTEHLAKVVEEAIDNVENLNAKVNADVKDMRSDMESYDDKLREESENVQALFGRVDKLDNNLESANTSIAVERARMDDLLSKNNFIVRAEEYDLEIIYPDGFYTNEAGGYARIVSNGVNAVLEVTGNFERIQNYSVAFARIPAELAPLLDAPEIECNSTDLEITMDKEDPYDATNDNWVLKYKILGTEVSSLVGTGKCVYALKNLSISELCIAEITDARIGVDGNVYGSLGGAIRTQLYGVVKETDYATSAKAGVVKVGSDSMGVKLNANNVLVIASAGVSEIEAMASANRPITPYYLKQAIKTGLSKNDLEWTDTEKESARKVIGAISTEELEKAMENVGNPTDEQIQAALDPWLSENGVQTGATKEQADQITKNKEDIGKLQQTVNDMKDNGVIIVQDGETLTVGVV